MATAPPPTSRPRQARRTPMPPAPHWRRWLLLGLLFGLGYGLTQRLLEVRWGEGSQKAPPFQTKSTPSGTTLENLRGQHGEKAKPLPADLEELSRQKQEEKDQNQDQPNKEASTINKGNEPQGAPVEGSQQQGGLAQPPSLESSPPPTPPILPPPPIPLERPSPPASQPPAEGPATLP